MAETVFDVKTKREGERLPKPPFPNALGQRIYENVSKEGWDLWLAHSTMLINEYRLDLSQRRGVEELLKQCEEFFFGEGSDLPPDYKPLDEAKPEGGEET